MPGFTVLALLALSACGGAGGGGATSTPTTGTSPNGGGSSGGSPKNPNSTEDPKRPAPTFAVPNPYASTLEGRPEGIERLIVFGDSYSDLQTERFCRNSANEPCFGREAMWPVLLSPDAAQDSYVYAKSGASASNVGVFPTSPGNTIEAQVNKFNPEAATFGDRDLTVVYAGYNDINRLSDPLGQSLIDLKGTGRPADRGGRHRGRSAAVPHAPARLG